MQSKRQLNVELMRIFSMLLICLWHVNGHFLTLLPNAGSLVGKTLSLLMPYITFHVNLFVLITGYFGVRHLKRGLLKTSLLVIFYSLVLGALTSYLGGQDFSWTQLCHSLVRHGGSCRFIWFCCYALLSWRGSYRMAQRVKCTIF